MSTPQLPHRVISAVQIEHVRLVEARCKTSVRAAEGKLLIDYPVSSRVKEHKSDGTFIVEASIQSRVTREKPPQRAVILVQATFELTYKLPKKLAVSRSELEAFAGTNAIFNAWPYFREFVQSMFTRMTLPPPILRVYRMPSGPKPSGPKSGNGQHGQSQKGSRLD